MSKNKYISYITYFITTFSLCSLLFKLDFNHIDINYLSNEILYLYFFGIHVFLILSYFGIYQTIWSSYSSYLIIRYRNHKFIYYSFYKQCFINAIICTSLKMIIEYYIFRYFHFINHLFYFLLLFLILIFQFQLEIFFHKNISLLIMLIYLAVNLTIGDLLFEYQFLSYIPLFIFNLMMSSRMNICYSYIFIFIMIHLFIFIVGLHFIKKKDIL